MFFTRQHVKTVISVSDDVIASLTLAKNSQGFFVQSHEEYKLPEGTIVNGEILKADIFSTRLKKISEGLKNKNIDIILPYNNFAFTGAEFKKTNNKKQLKKNIRNYFATTSDRQSWFQTHVCEYSVYQRNNKDYVVFHCLPQDIFQSYFFLFQQAGMTVQAIIPDILSYDHFFTKEKTKVLYIGEHETRLIEYTNGIFTQSKVFEFSYTTARQYIMKLTKMDVKDANKILEKYGFLRSHPDEKVYRKLTRSLNPLLEVLQKTKSKSSTEIVLIFEKTPILGIADILGKTTQLPIREFDIVNQSQYPFHEVLSIHVMKGD